MSSPARRSSRPLSGDPLEMPPRLPPISAAKAAPAAAPPPNAATPDAAPSRLPVSRRPRATPSPARDASKPLALPKRVERSRPTPPRAPASLRSPKRGPSPLKPIKLNPISPRGPAWGGLRRPESRRRPATASALYALAAANIAERLAADESAGAACPGDPERLHALIGDLFSAKASARAPSTRNKDEWGYQWWCRCCAALPCDPLRPTDSLYPEREAFIAGFAVMYMAANMQPRRRSAKKPKHASPLSAWAAYKHARTVLAAWGSKLPDISLVRDTLKGLMRNHVAAYRDEVLAPERKRPYFRKHETAMLALLDTKGVASWSPALHNTMRWAVCFARCTGARKAELTADGGCHFYTRGHLTWYCGNTPLPPTPDAIRRATRLRIRPAASKADPFNIHWGSLEMWFDVIPGQHMSVALALRELELRHPCPPELRNEYPLIFDPEHAALTTPPAVSRAWLDHKLRIILAHVMSPGEAEVRSWHSWRVTLACSLRAARDAKHPDGRSLALVKVFGRWRSDSAVELYGRLDPDAYAGHVSASLAADSASINAAGTAEAMDNVDPPLFESMATEQEDAYATEESGDELPKDRPSKAKAAAVAAAPRAKATAAKPSRKRKRRAAPKPSFDTPRAPAGTMCVIVPAECFPTEVCAENGGRGWSAFAAPRSKGTASVMFETARDAEGRPFRPVLLQRDVLLAYP